MRFLFLNQYAPPEPPPTARLLGELADYLRGRGHEVEIVSQGQDYRGRPAGGRGRLKREMTALLTIWRRAGQSVARQRPDLILALSSPPGLMVVAAWLAWRRRVPLAHWAMDLYPELALTLGEIRPGAASRALRAAMAWAYRRTALAVALDDDMREHFRTEYNLDARVLPPWPARTFEQRAATASAAIPDPAAQWTWLYSGNLGRAHEWQTLLDAQHLLEARGVPVRLVFQGDGAARAAAQAYARQIGLARCEWKGYVTEDALIDSFLRARVLIVTQRPETRGLLWPSKLSAMEQLPRPVLFIGPADGAIARSLQARGNAGVFAPGDAEGTARWVEEQFHREAVPAFTFRPTAEAGRATLERWLVECV